MTDPTIRETPSDHDGPAPRRRPAHGLAVVVAWTTTAAAWALLATSAVVPWFRVSSSGAASSTGSVASAAYLPQALALPLLIALVVGVVTRWAPSPAWAIAAVPAVAAASGVDEVLEAAQSDEAYRPLDGQWWLAAAVAVGVVALVAVSVAWPRRRRDAPLQVAVAGSVLVGLGFFLPVARVGAGPFPAVVRGWHLGLPGWGLLGLATLGAGLVAVGWAPAPIRPARRAAGGLLAVAALVLVVDVLRRDGPVRVGSGGWSLLAGVALLGVAVAGAGRGVAVSSRAAGSTG